jgi:hypothetical protein
LHSAYEEFVADIARVIPVIKVDYNRFRTAEDMAKVIKIEYEKIANVRKVGEGEFREACGSPLKGPVESPVLAAGEGDEKVEAEVQ